MDLDVCCGPAGQYSLRGKQAGLEDWRTGGLEDWRYGGLEDWRRRTVGLANCMKDWRTGGMQEDWGTGGLGDCKWSGGLEDREGGWRLLAKLILAHCLSTGVLICWVG